MSVFRRREAQPEDVLSPACPADPSPESPESPESREPAPDEQGSWERGLTAHDITRHAMVNEAALDRLIRLERSRNRWNIGRFVAKIAALTAAVVVVVHAARGIDVNVPAAVWPAVSLAGASAVTALVTLAGGRLLGRRGGRAGAPGDGTGQAPGDAP
ncbi:hypothetical protein [Streptomyces sp. B6B3]|uniref:hypothetical protein n=1 Tax=Streptomyces sp. B6B3 TaxID=3153570 RepID=UPI00325F6E83